MQQVIINIINVLSNVYKKDTLRAVKYVDNDEACAYNKIKRYLLITLNSLNTLNTPKQSRKPMLTFACFGVFFVVKSQLQQNKEEKMKLEDLIWNGKHGKKIRLVKDADGKIHDIPVKDRTTRRQPEKKFSDDLIFIDLK